MTARVAPRILVVGAGFMGTLHARAIRTSERGVLCGVVDRDERAAGSAGAELAAPSFTDLHRAIEEARPDAAIIATPDPAHRRAAEIAIEAGLPLLVEKPLATTVRDAEAIAGLARRRGVRLLPGHLVRFDLRYARVAEAVRDGELGRPVVIGAGRWGLVSFGARVRAVTSPLWHFLIHDIDAVQWVAGGTIDRIDGAVQVDSPAGLSAFTATGSLSTGTSFQLGAGWTLPEGSLSPRFTLEVHGERGHASLAAQEEGLIVSGATRAYRPDTSAWPIAHGKVQGMLRREIDHFITALAEDTPFAITPEEGVAAVRAAVALEGAAAHRKVGQP